MVTREDNLKAPSTAAGPDGRMPPRSGAFAAFALDRSALHIFNYHNT